MDEKVTNTAAEDADLRDPRVYEVGYHLMPQIKEEDLDAEIDKVRNLITNQGGLPIAEGRATLIDLAYPMMKIINNERKVFHKGYFGWIKFDVSPEKMAELKNNLDQYDEIIRFLITSTVREDTMVHLNKTAGKFSRSEKTDGETAGVGKTEEKPKAPIDEAKLDQQIDELVVKE